MPQLQVMKVPADSAGKVIGVGVGQRIAEEPTTKAEMSDAKPEILCHTSLRGLAALGVAIHHLAPFWPENVRGTPVALMLLDFHVFVDLFFVLSGFIIAYVYRDAFLADPRPARVARYLWKRVARLYPLFLLTMILYLGIELVQGRPDALDPGRLFGNALMIQIWSDAFHPSYNTVSWSISGELAAYLVFPLLVLLGRTVAGRVAILVALIGLYAWYLSIIGGLWIEGTLTFKLLLLRAFGGFFLGFLVHDLWDRSASLAPAIKSVAQVASVLGMFWIMAIGAWEGWLPVFFAVLVLSTASDEGVLPRLLNNRPLWHLGVWSYALYMTHKLVVFVLHFANGRFGLLPEGGSWIVVAAALVVMTVLAALTYKWFEKPTTRWMAALRPAG